MIIITEQQYQRLMKEYHHGGVLQDAAMKAGMDRKTARRYVKAGQSPTQLRGARGGRTRPDPLTGVWDEARGWLEITPELEAKALFEHLLATRPGVIDGRALRTFQRRVEDWRRRHGPPKEVFFAQVHVAGECIQTDWTNANELGVTIAGQAYAHLLVQAVLPWSNWQWALPCGSESSLSLRTGLQGALWELGGVPRFSQTDQSSTATHQLKRGESRRGFNTDYLALCRHLGLEARTIAVGQPNQNGDIEAAQGHLKRRLKNHLILRRSRDFGDVAAYAGFVAQVCRGANALRLAKVQEERGLLGPLPRTRFPEAEEFTVRVSSYSTARVKQCAYSVPARLVGAMIQVQVSEDTVRFAHLGELIVSYPRSRNHGPQIDYRHVIASLVRKPGAFARYLYREELFPRLCFRQAYDRLKATDEAKGDQWYLRLLALAVELGEDPVADQIGSALRQGEVPLAELLALRLRQPATVEPIQLAPFTPELSSYDTLIVEVAS
jgi:transposase InsO family protein